MYVGGGINGLQVLEGFICSLSYPSVEFWVDLRDSDIAKVGVLSFRLGEKVGELGLEELGGHGSFRGGVR